MRGKVSVVEGSEKCDKRQMNGWHRQRATKGRFGKRATSARLLWEAGLWATAHDAASRSSPNPLMRQVNRMLSDNAIPV